MPNFGIDCRSGVAALVKAWRLQKAQEEWDAEVEAGFAEPGTARYPRPGEVREIAQWNDGEHDYR